MKKISNYLLTFVVLTSFTNIPLTALAATTNFATAADFDNYNKNKLNSENCGKDTIISETNAIGGSHTKPSRKIIALSLNSSPIFKIEVPFDVSYSIFGKPLQPYTTLDKNTVSVGEPVEINQAVQDTNCAVGRQYNISITKGTIASLDAQTRKQINGYIKEGTLLKEISLPSINLMIGKNKAIITPSTLFNSGGYEIGYNSVTVEKRGYLITITDPESIQTSNINAEMLRIASSVK